MTHPASLELETVPATAQPRKNFIAPRANTLANRGKKAEDAVHRYLKTWQEGSVSREFNRLLDTRAAGRLVKAAPADFEFFHASGSHYGHGLIEVKETGHDYRLAYDRVTQYPRLMRRRKAGGSAIVLVYHSGVNRWRALCDLALRKTEGQASWDMRALPAFNTPGEALQWCLPEAFLP